MLRSFLRRGLTAHSRQRNGAEQANGGATTSLWTVQDREAELEKRQLEDIEFDIFLAYFIYGAFINSARPELNASFIQKTSSTHSFKCTLERIFRCFFFIKLNKVNPAFFY